MTDGSFTADVAAIRDRARQKTGQRPVTDDPAVRRMLEHRVPGQALAGEQVLAGEEEHADDLAGLLGA
jgi:hypothetical protein